jgi:hypothetical protein
MLYTFCICLLTKLNVRWPLIPPLVALYYDHTLWPSLFIDSSSICVDVVAGTIVALKLQQELAAASVVVAWVGLVLWSALGACHIALCPQNMQQHQSVLTTLGHMVVPTAGLVSVLPTTTTNSSAVVEQPIYYWPFMCRSTAYLLLVTVDVYTLRPPTQRERDRIGMLRYGAVLFAPNVAQLCVCCLGLAVAQIAKLYYYHHDSEQQQLPTLASPHNNKHSVKAVHHHGIKLSLGGGEDRCNNKLVMCGNNNNNSSNTNVDALNFEEAFKLAKLQFMDGKSSH